ncbi:MAG: 16S rRNA (adenine(1518)-N(6)/adenine(1519)-N(6))-dimethyltransferase RsmA [Pyrinomonadaceae bacterium]
MRNKNSKAENRKPKIVFAKKSFGQNFLVDENYINKMISALNPQKGETIIEIGAGRGALTEKLVEAGANVVAVELERDMIAVLHEKFSGKENFRLVEADALKVDFSAFRAPHSAFRIKLVANLPFYISTAILQKLIEQRAIFSEMILMFQREVVERITAKAGSSERGFLTVLVETHLETEKLFDIPPQAFHPAPKVWSSVVHLITKESDKITFENENFFRELVSESFKQKRKTIWNNLKNFEPERFDKKDWEKTFLKAGISPHSRAESLTIEEWKKLFDAVYYL